MWRFTNKNVRKIQVAATSNQTENFQIYAGETDSTVLIPEGAAFTFYWRDDDTTIYDIPPAYFGD